MTENTMAPGAAAAPDQLEGAEEDLGSVARVVALAGGAMLGSALAAHWDVGPWAVTVVVAVAIAAVGRQLRGAHAALAVILTWCVITGFVTNGDARLTFDSPDLWRLTLIATAAAVARAYAHPSRRAS